MPTTFADAQSFIKDNSDSEEVKGLVGSFVTPERVSTFLNTDPGLTILQPKLDAHFTKGLETWKTKTLPGIVEAEITKRNPAETENDKRFRKLESQNEMMQTKISRDVMKADVTKDLNAAKIPIEFAGHLVGEDEAATRVNVTTFVKLYTGAIETQIKEILKKYGRDPRLNDDTKGNGGMNSMIRKAAGH